MVQSSVSKAEEIVATQATSEKVVESSPESTVTPTVASLEQSGDTSPPPTQPEPAVQSPTVEEAPSKAIAPEATSTTITEELNSLTPPTKASIISYALGSYLCYPYFPWPLTPVHGAYHGGWSMQSLIGYAIAAFVILLGFFRKTAVPLWLFLGQAACLVPFLGFIVAPYMTFTTVSEQHYYLALPFAILSQLWLLSLLPKKSAQLLLALITIVLFFLTNDYSSSFQNEQVFYERIRYFRPTDRLAALNLAGHYAHNGQPRTALKVITKALTEVEADPILRNDPLNPLLELAKETYEEELNKSQ